MPVVRVYFVVSAALMYGTSNLLTSRSWWRSGSMLGAVCEIDLTIKSLHDHYNSNVYNALKSDDAETLLLIYAVMGPIQ